MGKRALLSVANKNGIAEFARGLFDNGFEVISSGGTAQVLEKEQIPVTRVVEVTGFPEMLGGRVKTLHPKIHGGILARREIDSDLEDVKKHDIELVDVVVVNFYPFEKKLADKSSIEEIIENIDIGGPSMLRAAAKNFKDVVPLTDPSDYALVLRGFEEGIDMDTRLYLAAKAFEASARYERAIEGFFLQVSSDNGSLVYKNEGATFPDRLLLQLNKVQELRYGENPHQNAAFYRDSALGVAGAKKLHGKELSYNNLLDLDAAWRLLRELPKDRAAAVVVKHTNPAGAALGASLQEAYVRARATDPTSAFGGIVALNHRVDLSTAEELASTFIEAVVAPSFDDDSLLCLTKKKNIRLMTISNDQEISWSGNNLSRILGGLLVQEWDRDGETEPFEVVTERSPTDAESVALRLAWIVSKHVKSNAIVLAKDDALIGVGAGQMSRVDSCRIAVEKAQSLIKGSVAASDAFFPFRDGVDTLANAGVAAIVQPGGSVRDGEVVEAANEHNVAMVFTGKRHFKH